MPKLSEQKWEIVRKVFEVGLGVAVAVALTLHKDIHSVVDETAVGLLTIIAAAFILEPIAQMRSVRELRSNVDGIQATLSEMQKGMGILHSDFADRIDRYTLALRFTNKSLDQDEMPNAWERMLWSMRGNLDATTFVKPSDYARSYPDLGIAIQQAKVQVNKVRIRRIFIVESETELQLIRPHVRKQIAAGIEVSYLLYSEVTSKINLSRDITLDFGLFEESKSVFLWILNEDRAVSSGRIELETDGKDGYERYRKLFDRLCRESHRFPDDLHTHEQIEVAPHSSYLTQTPG